jgi:hypothetical protein
MNGLLGIMLKATSHIARMRGSPVSNSRFTLMNGLLGVVLEAAGDVGRYVVAVMFTGGSGVMGSVMLLGVTSDVGGFMIPVMFPRGSRVMVSVVLFGVTGVDVPFILGTAVVLTAAAAPFAAGGSGNLFGDGAERQGGEEEEVETHGWESSCGF